MTVTVANRLGQAREEFVRHAPVGIRLALKVLLVGIICYLAIQVGHLSKLPPHDISALWPASAVLVSVLVASPSAIGGRTFLIDLTTRAVNTDPRGAWAWSKRADALGWQRRWEEAFTANERARKLGPESLTFVVQQASLLLAEGRPSEALEIAKGAIALDPEAGQSWTAPLLCDARLVLGAYNDAAPACEVAAGLGVDWWGQLYLAALYAQQSQPEKAALARAALLKLRPGLTIAKWKVGVSFNHPAYQQVNEEHIQAGLLKAGFRRGESRRRPCAKLASAVRDGC